MPVNNKIKIRRGNNIDLPSGGTESGELRYSIDTKELYIDDGSLNIKIGGDPYAFPVSIAQKAALNLKQTVFTGICQEQFLTENDIIIDNTALTLTIATVKNGQSISALNPICFYTDGNGTAVKHEKSAPVVFNFTNTDGVWYFYFDSSGNPIATQTSWSDFSTMASVYRFYWNSTLAVPERRVIESVEYHKNDISWADHMWKHSEGTKYLSGFDISHNATPSATPNINGSNAVVTLSSGSNIDDNMEYSVTHAASGSVKFTQNLGTGLLPATSGKFICISNDASLRLQKIPATDFPFLWNATTNIPQYLTPTGVRTDVSNGYFFVYYIYALQDPRYGEAIKIKSAETHFASSTLAAAHNWEQLQAIFPTLRDGEIRLLYKLTFEYKSAYNIGTKKAALRTVDDLRKQKTTTTATAGGLLPATSVVVSPIGNIASTNVQSALQELDSEKQPVGTYSTDIHSNITALNAVSGTNTGDETLSSIKTKLGAATSVSDGYLKYQDYVKFDGKEPSFSKNTGFNKNFGTTTGTVLEGRTFGTAAGSAVGDFQPTITGLTTNYIPKWNGSSFVNSLISDDGAFVNIGETLSGGYGTVLQAGANINSSIASTISNQSSGSSASTNLYLNAFGNSWVMRVGSVANNNNAFSILTDRSSPVERFKIETNGVVTISSTTTSTLPTTGALVVGGGIGADHVRANNFYGNGSNLTGVQLPITLTTNGTSGAATLSGNVLNVPNYTSSGSFIQNQSSSAQIGSLWVSGNILSNDKIEGATLSTERVDINTSGEQINFWGTSGGGVLSQPFRGLNYKKVTILLTDFVGNKNINYLTAFTYPPAIVITDGLSSSLITSKSTTSVTITSASSATGILILEGY